MHADALAAVGALASLRCMIAHDTHASQHGPFPILS
jgi:hypothetical protein